MAGCAVTSRWPPQPRTGPRSCARGGGQHTRGHRAQLGQADARLRAGSGRRGDGLGPDVLGEAKSIVTRADAMGGIGKLLAMQGEIRRCAEHMRLGAEGSRDAGQLVEAAASSMIIAFVELRAGAPDAAESALRTGLAELERLGNRAIVARQRSRSPTCWRIEVHTTRQPGCARRCGKRSTRTTSWMSSRSILSRVSSRLSAATARRASGSPSGRSRWPRRSTRTTPGSCLRVARPHARARRQAGGGARGCRNRARDLRGQG